jgi:hypothetical protein
MHSRSPIVTESSSPAPENLAINRCMDAWQRVYREQRAKGKPSYSASDEAASAYRKAMPPLSGHENISDFIACVAHGMLIGSIDSKDATKLLYAAQVALGTVRRQPSSPKAA